MLESAGKLPLFEVGEPSQETRVKMVALLLTEPNISEYHASFAMDLLHPRIDEGFWSIIRKLAECAKISV